MKSAISYKEYIRQSTGNVNDPEGYTTIITTDATNSIISGNLESIQSVNPDDKLVMTNSLVKFEVSSKNSYDPQSGNNKINIETVLNDVRVISILNHNLPKNTQIDITWDVYEAGNLSYQITRTVFTYSDWAITKHICQNDYFVFDDVVLQDPWYESCRKVTVEIKTTQVINSQTEIGRLWVGNLFQQSSKLTSDCVFDGGWSTEYITRGEVSRNQDNNAGYKISAPVQRKLTVKKSKMDYEMAYGKLTHNVVGYTENMFTASWAFMAMTVNRFDDVIVFPDYTDVYSMGFTAVWGSIQNSITIQKNSQSKLYSSGLTVLEFTGEQD